MPLQYRRNYLTDRFLARSLTQTSSALHQQLLNVSSNFCSFSSPPIMQKSQTHPSSETLPTSTSPYLSKSPPPLPSNLSEGHTLPTPKIRNHVPPNPVLTTHVPIILTLHQIFTDGSKSDLGVGAALWIPSLPRHYSFSLPSFSQYFMQNK